MAVNSNYAIDNISGYVQRQKIFQQPDPVVRPPTEI